MFKRLIHWQNITCVLNHTHTYEYIHDHTKLSMYLCSTYVRSMDRSSAVGFFADNLIVVPRTIATHILSLKISSNRQNK